MIFVEAVNYSLIIERYIVVGTRICKIIYLIICT